MGPQTPSGKSEFTEFGDEELFPPALVGVVGKTEPRDQLRCIKDLHEMLKAHGDWMLLGCADEQFARSPDNPVGCCYGLIEGVAWSLCQLGPTRFEGAGSCPSRRAATKQLHASHITATQSTEIVKMGLVPEQRDQLSTCKPAVRFPALRRAH